MDTYPCPACGATADLASGCLSCHRPPNPEAAQVTALDAAIKELAGQVTAARNAYYETVSRFNATLYRRNELAARVAATRPVLAPPVPLDRPSPVARPETSTRVVQNLLFVLGGLLLGSAAIVFTAVAWANFGVTGRAAILGGVTLLVLAVPPLALRRRLAGTAETFAALGLLLVLLDGYAAWAVDLGGVTGALSPTRYAGVVFAGTAAVAFGYGRLNRLAGPGFAALGLAQPVLPLLLAGSGLGSAGWAVTFSAVALADLATLHLVHRPAAIRVTAWVLAGVSTAAGTISALAAVLLAGDPGAAGRAGGALVVAALLLVAAASVAPVLRDVAGAAVTVAVAIGAARVLGLAWPDQTLATVAGELTVLAVAARLLPVRLRGGPRIAVLVLAGVTGLIAGAVALAGGAATATVALRQDLAPLAHHVDLALPIALVLLAAAFAVVLPRAATIPVVVAGAVLLALAVPVAAPLLWWAPSLVDGVVLVPLALAAARTRSSSRAVLFGLPAVLLTAHAVAVGLVHPASIAAVLGGVVAVGVATAAAAARRAPIVGALGGAIALLALPGLGAALGRVAGLDARPYAAMGLALATGAVVALRHRLPVHAAAGAVAVLLGGLGVSVAALQIGGYGAVAVLCDVLAGAAVLTSGRPGTRAWYLPTQVVLTVLTALVPIGTAVPAAWTLLVSPYGWLGQVWSGRPAGTGLAPAGFTTPATAAHAFGFGSAAVTFALLALAVAVGCYVWLRPAGTVRPAGAGTVWHRAGVAALWASGPAALAVLATVVALGAPWPVAAAASLAIGVGAALLGALRPVPLLAWVAVPAAGAGLAGTLATRPSTLAGLAAVLVAAAVCAIAGRRAGTRMAGWLVAVGSGAALAFASARAAEVPTHWGAFWVLGAAALALAAGLFAGTRDERRAVEAAAHATAAVALLLTAGGARYSAGILVLWGLALGLRALWPAEPAPARRGRVVAGTVCELVAYWVVLATSAVTLLEAYTLPAAGVALLAGWLATRSRPTLHSWIAYGPALLAGFAPSLALVLVVPGDPLRRLALGLAAAVVVVAGSVGRRQAPVLVGGVTLVIIAAHEAALLWDLLPRWIPLATAGLALVGLAITYERRRRDLGRLRAAVGRMH